MKIGAQTTILVAAAGAAAWAGGGVSAADRKVTVCMDTLPGITVGTAQTIAARMFTGIGMKLEWRTYHCPSQAIGISLTNAITSGIGNTTGQIGQDLSLKTPSDSLPGALGYAASSEGTHIVVLWDRLQLCVSQDRRPSLLARVIAHEITHVLQGYSRHSQRGLMKAHWNSYDYFQMAQMPLAFATEDIEPINRGLARRESRESLLTAGAPVAEYHNVAVGEAVR